MSNTAVKETPTKENIEIRPTIGMCQDCTSGRALIERKATVKIDGRNLCDYHAEQRMIAACRRDTSIRRYRYSK